ncbi:replication initiator protein [Blackfly microvirus SF02]|uniref:Replication initiator protein n=1 Tax=Blackfly microvirus SF02 TaxID=2576452 RepID=A0A4P8PKS9_9VIRU|nr:replication initiator protein [Blackfly microvirus SF02]
MIKTAALGGHKRGWSRTEQHPHCPKRRTNNEQTHARRQRQPQAIQTPGEQNSPDEQRNAAQRRHKALEMACTGPLQAYKTESGRVALGRPPNMKESLALPCRECQGCRTAAAKEWALRCHLELQQHHSATFVTLTYNDQWLPPTLDKSDLARFLKRLRYFLGADRTIRFFASGEYGEKQKRPHYHLIIFGAHHQDDQRHIAAAWKKGHIDLQPVSPATIAYVAGYTSKKTRDAKDKKRTFVDSDGCEWKWQPPFIQMSLKPGIGANAKQHTDSWRAFAVHNGHPMPVPKYLHEAWKKTATPEQVQKLLLEKRERANSKLLTFQQLEAQEKINNAKQAISAAKRTL